MIPRIPRKNSTMFHHVGLVVAIVSVASVITTTTTTVVGAFVYPLTSYSEKLKSTTKNFHHQQLHQHLMMSSSSLNEKFSGNDKDEDEDDEDRHCVDDDVMSNNRRNMLFQSLMMGAATATSSVLVSSQYPQSAVAEDPNPQQYDDFIKDPDGWSYRDVSVGTGVTPKEGDRVVYEWSGYTIGYFGRPFQAKGGPTGGAFDKEIDFSRTVIGSKTIVTGMESGIKSMKVGGIRQIIVPYGPLSYPPTKDGDPSHNLIGPKPTTFSGERALNFVLDNPRVDRTLLFNVKVIRIDKSDGKGGFIRGDR